MEKVIIIKYGELALRGNNRFIFEKKLLETIKNKIKEVGDFYIVKEQGRLIVECNGDFDYDEVISKIVTTFGIVGVCPGIRLKEQNIENIKKHALEHIKEQFPNQVITFKVDTKRSNKKYPIKSTEISAIVGGYILENMNNVTVNVIEPDVTLNIELRNDVYIYSKVIKGLGGLPSGSSGKGMLLLSGGIDSPVAGFMVAKRGIKVEAVYFHSSPYTSERAKEKVIDLAKRLAVFCNEIKIHIVPFTDVQVYLKDNTQHEKLTIFLKRAMLKTAEKIALNSNCQCLITGDSVGQVASQTIHALKAVESATKLPIIRPLSCFDKQEIVDIATKIKTYDVSILPYEDCCTIFVAKHPETKPKASIIERIESSLFKLNDLIDKAIQDTQELIISS